MKRRILFVDDEARVLEGLENLLRGYRKQWAMTFAQGALAAKAEIDAAPFDVVVSDMRMPTMDGAQLLAHVRDQHPSTVRIILSGYAELEAAHRAVPVAHQFLIKPCDPVALSEVIERVCALRLRIDDEAIRRVIGKIDRLPSAPKIYGALTQALLDPRVDGRAIAQILRQDVAMCAKLLQLVNSAFFRAARTITSIEQAVGFLGINAVRDLVMAVEVFDARRIKDAAHTAMIEQLQRRSLATGDLARRVAAPKQADDAFMAGLLHDVGELVLVTAEPAKMTALTAEAKRRGVPRQVVEAEQHDGVTHAEIGGYLLGLWGLPHVVVEAVTNHHAPWQAPHPAFDVLDAVYVADCLVRESDRDAHDAIDTNYLATLSIDRRLDEWRRLATANGGPS